MVGWLFTDDLIRQDRRAQVRANAHSDKARLWLAQEILDWIQTGKLHPQLSITVESFCSYCGRQCTDPVSVARGAGPTCYGRNTESQHQTRERVTAAKTSQAPESEQLPLMDSATGERYNRYLANLDEMDVAVKAVEFSKLPVEEQKVWAS